MNQKLHLRIMRKCADKSKCDYCDSVKKKNTNIFVWQIPKKKMIDMNSMVVKKKHLHYLSLPLLKCDKICHPFIVDFHRMVYQ